MTEGYNYYGVALPKLPEGAVALGAVLSIKYMDANGKINYNEYKSGDLHSIEALGMLDTFTDTIRTNIMNASRG